MPVPSDFEITSLANPKVKAIVKLRQRSHRDDAKLMLAEGYREIKRGLDHGWRPVQFFYCEELYLKNENEHKLIERSREMGCEIYSCSAPVFMKMAYRERPEGLLAVGPQVGRRLEDLKLDDHTLLLVAESIEKPGNLGTMLRSADAAGAAGVIVCDRCTDLFNPNVVRASTGTIFSMPIVECDGESARDFLRRNGFSILAATPHAEKFHSDVDLTGRVALVVGAEQYGLTDAWMDGADLKVRIPMLGMADSLNVSAATTILLFEAVRQRVQSGVAFPPPPLPEHHDA